MVLLKIGHALFYGESAVILSTVALTLSWLLMVFKVGFTSKIDCLNMLVA